MKPSNTPYSSYDPLAILLYDKGSNCDAAVDADDLPDAAGSVAADNCIFVETRVRPEISALSAYTPSALHKIMLNKNNIKIKDFFVFINIKILINPIYNMAEMIRYSNNPLRLFIISKVYYITITSTLKVY